ncbi:hypothetical protein B0T17DRAFT_533036 [Bombardia bombarda]|uniref:Uncharacterized protein n=1 Tax=Bombardia bombarda TaxID=252184 RepID=A0AA39WTE8_9PEZI|nr:hypothetical protein B0T17DRAFT_533036 [Bombardia bombarda]
MASLAAACRISSRLAGRTLRQDAAVRGFRTAAAARAAQNFTMPALSPTMTEGNIATWQVKEGDKFVAGDVLLEIETDKATMDVEAQEDGIVMKIIQGDGTKGIPVGSRIAVLAEEGDDISALEIPADENTKASAPKAAENTEVALPATLSESQSPATSTTPASTASSSPGGAKTHKQTYPLLPSVIHLVKENGLDESTISSITPTGPNGRLLKGDVLAYLGKIDAKTPAEVSSRFQHAAHLDLSNIKIKAPEAAKKPAAVAPAAPPVAQDARVALPVSLAAVIEVQQRIQKKLGIFLPLSTFISRATDLANDELPLPAGHQPTADELFDQVLGLDKVGRTESRGFYSPQIGTPLAASFARRSSAAGKRSDIIDILAGAPRRAAPKQAKTQPVLPGASSAGPNVFSLVVPKTEEKRAQVFLERVKLVLEKDPGRLVL